MIVNTNLPPEKQAQDPAPLENIPGQPESTTEIPSSGVTFGHILGISLIIFIIFVAVFFVINFRPIKILVSGYIESGQYKSNIITQIYGIVKKINNPAPKPTAVPGATTTSPRQPNVTNTVIPTPSSSTKVAATATLKPTSTPTPIPTPTPTPPDTQAPAVTIQGGPAQGQTVEFSNLCFPLYISDNRSTIPNLWVRTKLDSGNWTDWTTNVAPCYNGLGNGQHTFVVQGKDQAGNISAEQSRCFSVDVFNQGVMAGTVFLDANHDGNLEASEGIPFSVINLYTSGSSSPVSSQSTGADGKFSFSNLPAGNYTVKAEDNAGRYNISGLNYATSDISRSNPTVNTIAFTVVLK